MINLRKEFIKGLNLDIPLNKNSDDNNKKVKKNELLNDIQNIKNDQNNFNKKSFFLSNNYHNSANVLKNININMNNSVALESNQNMFYETEGNNNKTNERIKNRSFSRPMSPKSKNKLINNFISNSFQGGGIVHKINKQLNTPKKDKKVEMMINKSIDFNFYSKQMNKSVSIQNIKNKIINNNNNKNNNTIFKKENSKLLSNSQNNVKINSVNTITNNIVSNLKKINNYLPTIQNPIIMHKTELFKNINKIKHKEDFPISKVHLTKYFDKNYNLENLKRKLNLPELNSRKFNINKNEVRKSKESENSKNSKKSQNSNLNNNIPVIKISHNINHNINHNYHILINPYKNERYDSPLECRQSKNYEPSNHNKQNVTLTQNSVNNSSTNSLRKEYIVKQIVKNKSIFKNKNNLSYGNISLNKIKDLNKLKIDITKKIKNENKIKNCINYNDEDFKLENLKNDLQYGLENDSKSLKNKKYNFNNAMFNKNKTESNNSISEEILNIHNKYKNVNKEVIKTKNNSGSLLSEESIFDKVNMTNKSNLKINDNKTHSSSFYKLSKSLKMSSESQSADKKNYSKEKSNSTIQDKLELSLSFTLSDDENLKSAKGTKVKKDYFVIPSKNNNNKIDIDLDDFKHFYEEMNLKFMDYK